jgi:hypothetical protein
LLRLQGVRAGDRAVCDIGAFDPPDQTRTVSDPTRYTLTNLTEISRSGNPDR